MIEKLKGKKELLHPTLTPALTEETDEERAIRRRGQTDLQNDMEDDLLTVNEAMGVEPIQPAPKYEYDPANPTAKAPEAPKQYKPVTITRESDRPGDIKTTEQRQKTVGAPVSNTGSPSTTTSNLRK